jgi:hypothetical protein
MKFLFGSNWFSRSYYKFILFVIIKSELYFGGSNDLPRSKGEIFLWVSRRDTCKASG